MNKVKQNNWPERYEFDRVGGHHWLVQEIFQYWEDQSNQKFEFWQKFKAFFVGVNWYTTVAEEVLGCLVFFVITFVLNLDIFNFFSLPYHI
ncbi:MAG: hypothetical protein R3B41_01150 [Candidatus Doudnabacteria bacterium]